MTSIAPEAASDPRQRLLDAAIEHVVSHGMTDLSLRGLAAELGTSHRMLIHHFGSKEGVWVAIVTEVERQQRAALGELVAEPGMDLADSLRAWWRHISDPSLWPNERLFFEIYGQALQGRSPATALIDDVIEPWVAPAAAIAEARGMDPAEARSLARLGLAVTRGLLLDLLATGDREAADAAMERWITSVADDLSSGPSPDRRGAP